MAWACRSALLTAVALAFAAISACPTFVHAQVGRPADIGPRPSPKARPVEPPKLRAQTLIEDSESVEDAAPALRSTLTENQPDDSLATDAEGDDGPAQIRRQTIVDGSAISPDEPSTPLDGTFVTTEAASPVDGVADPLYDTRRPEDIAAFGLTVPGYDPTPLTVDMNPFLDRWPRRFFRFDPFEPVGIRMGSFIVLPEIELGAVAYSNVFRSNNNPRSDVATEVRPTLRAVSDWSNHALEFRATGLASFYDTYSTEDDRAYSIESRGRLDITRRTNIEALVGLDRYQEARGSINAPSFAEDRTNVDTRRAALAFNHRFNRLSVQLRGTYTDYDYSPVETPSGIVSNDERDYRQTTGATRIAYAFKPELGVFTDLEWNTRDYHAAPADGILRSSNGERLRLGVAFGSETRNLRGDVSVGWGEQRYDDSRLRPVEGVLIDGIVGWRISGLTSMLFKAVTDIGESTLTDSGGALTRTAGVEIRHAFQRRLVGTAGVSLSRTHYEGTTVTERDTTGQLGLEYYVSREVTLFGRYQHIDFESTDVTRNYNADEFRIGVRLRR